MKALVLHGFTGSLDTINLLRDYLEERGVEVKTPILRGHGTKPAHLFRVHWRDWVDDARRALVDLAPSNGEPVLVAGLSMGSLLACILAAEFPRRVERLALLAPAFDFKSRMLYLLPVLKKFYRTWSGDAQFADPDLLENNTNYANFPVESFEQVLALVEVTKDLLPQIRCPVATFLAKRDPVVPARVLKYLDKKVGSGPLTHYSYKRSYHEMLQDVEAEAVAKDVVNFLLPKSLG
jgi:carboxylesterase